MSAQNILPAKPGQTVTTSLGVSHLQPYQVQDYKLSELSLDYHFFSHALLFTHGHWPHDPVLDFVTEHNYTRPLLIYLPQAIFSGLGGQWDYIIFACCQSYWPQLQGFFASLAGYNPKQRQLHHVTLQDVTLEQLPLTLLNIKTATQQLSFRQHKQLWTVTCPVTILLK